MATYAAFKHLELFNIGKSKKRVLRPPGGGSSDIFGPTDAPATPRSIRNHMASNIFGSTQDATVKNNADSARRAQKNVDSYSRLFGEPERPFTPAKNHMKSSIPIGGVNSKTKTSMAPPTNGHTNKIVASTAATKMENGGGESHQNGVTKPELEEISLNLAHSGDHTTRFAESYNNAEFNSIPTTIVTQEHYQSIVPSTNKNFTNGSTKYCSSNTNNIKKMMNGGGNKIFENGGGSLSTSPSSSSVISPATTESSSVSPVNSAHSNKYSPRQVGSPRNPVTGAGIDSTFDRKRRLANQARDGNPVTGEGYKPAGAEINTTIPCLNGANQVINKNRIPPGGFSSGLW